MSNRNFVAPRPPLWRRRGTWLVALAVMALPAVGFIWMALS